MTPEQALAAAARHATAPPPLAPLQRALVVGAGGALGSALLAAALAAGRFQRVAALVDGPLQSALRGFDALPAGALFDSAPALLGDAPPLAPVLLGDAPPLAPVLLGDAPPLAPVLLSDAPPRARVLLGDAPPSAPVLLGDAPPRAPVLLGDAPPRAPVLLSDASPRAPVLRGDGPPPAPASRGDAPSVPPAPVGGAPLFAPAPRAADRPRAPAVHAAARRPLAAGRGAPWPELAFVVYERARHANGRDDAFVQPDPADLPALARALHARGTRRLVVVVPHAPALLPQALKAGFASRAEHAVAAIGFEHLVFLRTAQHGAPAAGPRLVRFAGWWLGQLRWMVPQHEQPVRAARLGVLAVLIGRALPRSPHGTRVVPPELLSAAAAGDAEAILGAWLARR